MAKKARGASTTCKAYRFKDKDPVIDELRTLFQDEFGNLNHTALNKVYEGGGPSVSCMSQWFFGGTLRPTNPTIEAAGRAIGWWRKWERMKK